ncbi:MAG: protein kinase [Planctomycetota bacterium]
MNTNTCQPDHATAFLNGDLTTRQEKEFVRHLDSCETCRERLEESAGDQNLWADVQALLSSAQPQSEETQASEGEPDGLSVSIQQVLKALQPTDDPRSLGRLDNFEVTGVVGSGAMGVVLKAKDTSLDRIVALKVMNPVLAISGAARSRFEREAKAAAAVHHHNVVAIHGVSTSDDLPYLVMPYLKGGSLRQRVGDRGPLSLAEILRIGSQIAAGLAAAHRQGVVHRDIKPSNIMLDDGVEAAVITDFGLARIIDDATMTRTGIISGTPEFMSPEQARGDAIDGKSDIFSFGSLLYMLCTGYSPFRAQTSIGVLRKITDETPRPIRQVNPEIPTWLANIIDDFHQKSAKDRPTASEAQATLEGCLAHVYQPDQVSLPERFRAVHPSSFRHLVMGAITMITALTLLALAMLPGSDDSASGKRDGDMPVTVGDTATKASDRDPQVDKETFEKEFNFKFADPTIPGKLVVDMPRGSIRVIGHASQEVMIKLSVPTFKPRKKGDSGFTSVRPQNLDFAVKQSANYIKVDSNSRRYVTNVEVFVPFNTQLDLDSYQEGKIEVRAVTGPIRVRSQNSDIKLIDVCGPVDAYGYNGNLSASFTSTINLEGSEFDSYNGTIDLVFPEDVEASLRYATRYGDVLTEFKLASEESALNVTSPADGELKIEFDEFVAATINGGGPELTLETTNGDIRLRRRK